LKGDETIVCKGGKKEHLPAITFELSGENDAEEFRIRGYKPKNEE
jgi:hypothetical protein